MASDGSGGRAAGSAQRRGKDRRAGSRHRPADPTPHVKQQSQRITGLGSRTRSVIEIQGKDGGNAWYYTSRVRMSR